MTLYSVKLWLMAKRHAWVVGRIYRAERALERALALEERSVALAQRWGVDDEDLSNAVFHGGRA